MWLTLDQASVEEQLLEIMKLLAPEPPISHPMGLLLGTVLDLTRI